MKALVILAIVGLVFLELNCGAVSHHNPFSNWSTYETGVGFVESPMECTHRLTMADVSHGLHSFVCAITGNFNCFTKEH